MDNARIQELLDLEKEYFSLQKRIEWLEDEIEFRDEELKKIHRKNMYKYEDESIIFSLEDICCM